jgi:hypothetical protein
MALAMVVGEENRLMAKIQLVTANDYIHLLRLLNSSAATPSTTSPSSQVKLLRIYVQQVCHPIYIWISYNTGSFSIIYIPLVCYHNCNTINIIWISYKYSL